MEFDIVGATACLLWLKGQYTQINLSPFRFSIPKLPQIYHMLQPTMFREEISKHHDFDHWLNDR